MKRLITSSDRYTPKDGYLYIFKHGIGPGTLPKDVNIIKTQDLPNYLTAVWLDRYLTGDELEQYDIPSETEIHRYLDRIGYCWEGNNIFPCDDVKACDDVIASEDFEDNEDKIYWVQAYYSKPHKGLADDLATNDWDAAIDKLIQFANDGYYIMFENLASGEGYEYDPDEVLSAVESGDIYTLRRLNSLYEG